MSNSPTAGKVRRCPICKAEAAGAYMPFCSKRCADIDLGKWFKGSYAIAGTDDDDDAESSKKSPPDADDQDQ